MVVTCPPETGPDPALGSWTKGGGRIPTKRYSTEQIVSKLRQAEEELSRGLRTPAMCKKRGISEQTYYRWRTKRSTIRFSKRWPRETSEPAETRAGGGLGPSPAGRVGVAGMLSAGPGAVDPPASGAEAG